MGCSLSRTRFFDRFIKPRPWIPVVVTSSALLCIILTLGICYAVVSSDGHLSNDPGFPAISALGDLMPEHIPFALGFGILCVIVGFIIFFRTAQLDMSRPGSILNNIIACIGWLALPWLFIMGAIPDSVSQWHFIGAGLAMLLLNVYLFSVSLLAIIWSCCGRPSDPRVSRQGIAYALYAWSALMCVLSVTLFGYWFAADNELTQLEWAGVGVIFAAFAPWIAFFALLRDQGYVELK